MARYEFKQGSSAKFWQVEVVGTTCVTTYGRIGTDGRETVKQCSSVQEAQATADKTAAGKVKKGYQLVGDEGGGANEGILGLEDENHDTYEPAQKFVFRTIYDFGGTLGHAKRGAAYRVRVEYGEDDAFLESLRQLIDHEDAAQLEALVVGNYGEGSSMGEGSEPIIEAIVSGRAKRPNLKAIYMGDIVQEESEVSWIQWADLAPLVFEGLEHLRVRGGGRLGGGIASGSLRSFVWQSGGLDGSVIDAVSAANLPNLEHLELWLGEENYGGIVDPAPLATILSGKLFPKLSYLGLRNSAIADQIAVMVSASPILSEVEHLDLSMGALGDVGARALIESPAVKQLKKLSLQHNFCSDAVKKELKALGPVVDVRRLDAEEEEDGEEVYRYISVAE